MGDADLWLPLTATLQWTLRTIAHLFPACIAVDPPQGIPAFSTYSGRRGFLAASARYATLQWTLWAIDHLFLLFQHTLQWALWIPPDCIPAFSIYSGRRGFLAASAQHVTLQWTLWAIAHLSPACITMGTVDPAPCLPVLSMLHWAMWIPARLSTANDLLCTLNLFMLYKFFYLTQMPMTQK